MDPYTSSSYRDKKVAVIGLGIEGNDLAEFLLKEGAAVTLSDKKPFHEIEPLIATLERRFPTAQIQYANPESLIQDLNTYKGVFVSQGIPENNPILTKASDLDIHISSMLELFMSRCPAPIVGITGSSGKTTTTALVLYSSA